MIETEFIVHKNNENVKTKAAGCEKFHKPTGLLVDSQPKTS